MGPRCYFEQWCGCHAAVCEWAGGLGGWTEGERLSLISTPFEGMPASLGPGLRTVSGASGHSSMFAAGSAGRHEFFSSIDAQFPPLSAGADVVRTPRFQAVA